jgi:DNA-binding response OmpR family regulator
MRNSVNTGLKVLIVEDEAMITMLLEDMLTDLGHHVSGTSSRMSDAEVLVSKNEADLAILDVNLAGQETYSLAQTLAARGVPFIFATGYGTDGIRGDWPGVAWIQKPFQIRELAAAIEKSTSNLTPTISVP